MSRIGNNPIEVPKDVTITINGGVVNVKGPKGELNQEFDTDAVSFNIEEGLATVARNSEAKDHKAKHGLYRSILSNMVEGVSKGFTIKQELVGVGYRAAVKANTLELSLGFSHNVVLQLPVEVSAEAVTDKGKAPVVTLTSCDKQLVGQVAAKLRSLRKPEPYKGKGIKFVGEQIRRKAGKSAGK